MGLRLFFLPNFPGATFIQGATFIPDSRVMNKQTKSRNFSYKYEKSRFNPLGKDFISEYELWHCSPDPTTNFEFRLTNFAKDQNDY